MNRYETLVETEFIVDSGSPHSLISKNTVKKLGLEIRKTKQKILGITSHSFEILGQINVSIFYKGDITISQFLVCQNVDLIGLDILKKVCLKLIACFSGSVGMITLLS